MLALRLGYAPRQSDLAKPWNMGRGSGAGVQLPYPMLQQPAGDSPAQTRKREGQTGVCRASGKSLTKLFKGPASQQSLLSQSLGGVDIRARAARQLRSKATRGPHHCAWQACPRPCCRAMELLRLRGVRAQLCRAHPTPALQPSPRRQGRHSQAVRNQESLHLDQRAQRAAAPHLQQQRAQRARRAAQLRMGSLISETL